MSISIEDPEGYRISELREVKVHGLPGIGSYTLVLALHFVVTPPRAETSLRNVVLRLEWGGNEQRMIGMALADGSPTRIHSHSPESSICFRLPLSAAQIEGVEARRNGGNFKLSLWLMGDVEQAGRSFNFAGRHEFEVRCQDWIEALERMEYCRTMLFELPVPSSDALIGELVVRAQAYLKKGDYEQVVILCRQAIEKVEGSAGDKSAAGLAVRKYRENRENMDTTERLLFLREALKNSTHLAIHPSQNHCGFSRDQAKAILSATISLLGLFMPWNQEVVDDPS